MTCQLVTQPDKRTLETKSVPYWLVNVPPERWPPECPKFLQNLPEKSLKMLSTPDHEFVRLDWPLVREIIAKNEIDRFLRLPSDLRRYLEFMARIRATYGSVMDFMTKERLFWKNDQTAKGARPFEHPDDYKILYNDWPYGVEADIVHLVVWSKTELEDDPATDDLTPHARQEIDDFVDKTFRSRMPGADVIWFKNWKSLKSIHSVEHFHVMLRAPDMEFVHEITHGDVPLVERLCAGDANSVVGTADAGLLAGLF